MASRFPTLALIAVFSIVALSGCASMTKRSSSSAPMAKVISTVQDSRQAQEKKPLVVPADVVIMFIPGPTNLVPGTTLRQAADNLKKQLLNYPKYVKSVSVVSSDYVKTKVSLAQIRSLYSADIIVILSYEQDQLTSRSGLAGLVDLTIVGMFLVPGVETKTATYVDGKVIHIPSNSMVLRASGSDKRSKFSTTYGADGTSAEESIESILKATSDLGDSLGKSLAKFDNYDISQAISLALLDSDGAADSGGKAGGKAERTNDYWEKVDTYKSSGGGSFGLVPLLISVAVFYAVRRMK